MSSSPPLLLLIILLGHWLISSESTSMQIDNMNGTITTKETSFIVDNLICLVFPPSNCMGSNVLPESEKSDVDIFREQFCPTQRRFICVEAFARHCIPTFKKYFDYITVFVTQIGKLKNKDLCSKGPYKKVHLDHAECLRFAKSVYEDMCPTNDEQLLNDFALDNYTFDKYIYCVQQIVLALCGSETESFLMDYLLTMNSTFGYNQPKPNHGPEFRNLRYLRP